MGREGGVATIQEGFFLRVEGVRCVLGLIAALPSDPRLALAFPRGE